MKKSGKISVIIATYNAEKYIANCLNSLMKQTYGSFNIILVDNNSTDKTIEIIEKFQRNNKNVLLMKKSINLGFAKANNAGLKKAIKDGSDYFLLLNQDTIVQPNLLNKGIYYLKKLKNIGALSPKILIKKNKRIWWIGTKLLNIRDLFKYGKLGISIHINKEKKDYKLKSIREVEAINGCSLFLKKEVVKNIGYLDESFFMYGEDIDYSIRLKKEGYSLYVIPGTIVFHDVDLEKEGIKNSFNKSMKRYSTHVKSSLKIIVKHFSIFYLFIWMLRIPISVIYELRRRIK